MFRDWRALFTEACSDVDKPPNSNMFGPFFNLPTASRRHVPLGKFLTPREMSLACFPASARYLPRLVLTNDRTFLGPFDLPAVSSEDVPP